MNNTLQDFEQRCAIVMMRMMTVEKKCTENCDFIDVVNRQQVAFDV